MADISEMNDTELLLNFNDCIAAEAKREVASKNSKFDKNNSKNVGPLPPPNPEFVKRKEAILTEIKKRKLEITQ